MYMKYFSVAEARAKFATLLDLSTNTDERVVITRNGAPTAIMLNIDEYESMVELIEIMSDVDSYVALLEDRANPDAETFSSEQVLEELEARVRREAAAKAQALRKFSNEA
ncbi:MAG: hypothetical protein RJB56_245 [Actinomycetota bacterium]|jgi:antitoxin YefM